MTAPYFEEAFLGSRDEGKWLCVLSRPRKLMPTVIPTPTSSHAVLLSPVIE